MTTESSISVNVREACREDAPLIANNNITMAYESEEMVLDKDTALAGVLTVFDSPARGTYYVAEYKGEIVGTLLITPEHSDWRNAMFWWIQSVYIPKPCRRQKVFTQMFEYLKKRGEESKAKDPTSYAGLRLYVERTNDQARKTYESLGMHLSHYEFYEF